MTDFITKKKTKSLGLTLIEIMVALAILGVFTTALVKMMGMSSESSVTFNFDTDTNYLVGEITADLADPNNCFQTFKDTAAVPAFLATPKSIVTRVNVDRTTTPATITPQTRALYLTGQPGATLYGPSRLEVTAYTFKSAGPAASTVDKQDWYVEVLVKNKTFGKTIGAPNLVRKIPLQTDWDMTNPASPALRSCRSLAQANSELWLRGAGTNIYYPGTVSIGASVPTTNSALEVAGDMTVTPGAAGTVGSVTANSFYYSSDRRLKENIKGIEDPMTSLSSIHGVSFDWKRDGRRDYGFIAQEVQKKIPEIVHQNPNGYLSVDYAKVMPFLVEALKNQQREIRELNHEIEQLKK